MRNTNYEINTVYSYTIIGVKLIATSLYHFFFFFQAEDGIRDLTVTGVQTCALPISYRGLYAHRDLSLSRLDCGSRLPREAARLRSEPTSHLPTIHESGVAAGGGGRDRKSVV